MYSVYVLAVFLTCLFCFLGPVSRPKQGATRRGVLAARLCGFLG